MNLPTGFQVVGWCLVNHYNSIQHIMAKVDNVLADFPLCNKTPPEVPDIVDDHRLNVDLMCKVCLKKYVKIVQEHF